MQKTNCKTKDHIDKDKRIVLTLHGWILMDNLFPSYTLDDNLTKRTCEQNITWHMKVHIDGATEMMI